MTSNQINRKTSADAMTAMSSVVVFSFVIAALYFGREMLIPLALAALLSFLLSPVVTRLERWAGRVGGTLLAVAILFAVLGTVGWVLTQQAVDLATRLPQYQQNIQTKLKGLKMPGGGRFTAFNKSVEALKKDLPGAEPSAGPTPPAVTTVAVSQKPGPDNLPKPPISNATPMPVQVVQTERTGPMEQLGMVLGTLAGPFGTAALVLLLLFCMLIQRENLRGRLIRLIGSGNISATTRGMDDAAQRVSKYLLMQLIVNASYGVVIAVGLFFIGVPNPLVWGVLATVLRFIPYVGAWIAMGFPIALSLAASTTWTMPVLTISLFVGVELISNNVLEPLLYGSSTGVSSIALIIAAVFWTWIWGPPGLILATPLTVCLVVMGRHVPRLSILSVLLSDDEALEPHEEFYHRLLAPHSVEASHFALTWLKAHSQTALYDSVFIPALASVEHDQTGGQFDKEQHDRILQDLRDVVVDIGSQPVSASKLEADKAVADADANALPAAPAPTCHVVTLPVRADRDELTGLMLTQLLQQHAFRADCLSAKLAAGEFLEHIDHEGAEAICVSVAAPSTVVHARYLCGKVRARFPKLRIVVGLWGATEQLTDATTRLRESGADEVVTSLADAVIQFSKFAAELARDTALSPIPSDEAGRVAELQHLHILDTEADPIFDRITSKLTHILNVPIALVTFVDQDRQFFKSQTGLPQDLAEARETPRDVSVCSHVVAANDVLVVEDLARDRRFARNSLLIDKKLRFYAGAPLRGKDGHVLGSLCVLDHKPRQFTEPEKRFLQAMAEEVMEAVNTRYLTLPRRSMAPRRKHPPEIR